MTSRETDIADRRQRERQLDQALADDRRGRDRLRDMADQPAPWRDAGHLDTPNREARP